MEKSPNVCQHKHKTLNLGFLNPRSSSLLFWSSHTRAFLSLVFVLFLCCKFWPRMGMHWLSQPRLNWYSCLLGKRVFPIELREREREVMDPESGTTNYVPVRAKAYPASKNALSVDAKFWRSFRNKSAPQQISAVTCIQFSPAEPHDFAVTSSTRVC
jgi:hypothetical protein